MKNAALIRNMFGLTQEEIAQLLGTTRTQWSMYEIGRRELPTTASIKLSVVTLHLHNIKQPSIESEHLLKAEKEKTQEWLKREKFKLEHKKRMLEKKIAIMENKRAECFAAMKIVGFLEKDDLNPPSSLAKGIAARVKSTLGNYPLQKLEEMNLRIEHLDQLLKSLHQKILK